jgi:hypothetical protein
MSTARTFNFPISTLIRDAKLLLAALRDAIAGTPVLARLTTEKNPQPDAALAAQIDLVETGGATQSGAIGDLSNLTQAQARAFTELERLMAAARRSGTLAFPHDDARLHSEFQVGSHEPADLASELERAQKILAAVTKYAAEVGEHGWIAADTTALREAVETLNGADDVQEAAKGKKKGATAGRNAAANALYKACLSVQNAARLAHPNTKAGDPAVVEARARFLLDTFPPTSGASAGHSPSPSGTKPMPPAVNPPAAS